MSAALCHMPPPEAFPHGKRARYVTGCRCSSCKASNVRLYHERQARAKELALEISAPPRPTSQAWTAPDGSKRIRVYTRGCPGVNGEPCPRRSHLRKDSKGGCCRLCRERLVWNGLVDASEARAHVLALSRVGVGYKSVAAAASVSTSIMARIRSGKRRRIRADTARRILAVDRGAVADHGFVPAGRTWRRIELLLEEGLSKAEIARRLGLKSPALQFRRRRVLARTAARVERFYRRMVEVPA